MTPKEARKVRILFRYSTRERAEARAAYRRSAGLFAGVAEYAPKNIKSGRRWVVYTPRTN